MRMLNDCEMVSLSTKCNLLAHIDFQPFRNLVRVCHREPVQHAIRATSAL